MDKFERKKWIINRIDRILENQINFKTKEESEFDSFTDSELKKFEQVEKGVLSSVAFSIPIIIGLFVQTYGWESLLGPIITILIGGFSIYLTVLAFKNKTKSIFDRIKFEIHSGKSKIYYPYGYFNANSIDINSFEEDDYKLFFIFLTLVVDSTLDLPGYFELRKWQNSAFLSKPIRQNLAGLVYSYKKSLDEGVTNFKNIESNCKNSKLVNPLIGFGTILLEYEQGKQPDINSILD